jgi:hypothetical protein
MTLYAANVRKTDDVVIGLWSGDDSQGYPSPPPESVDYIFNLTQSDHAQVNASSLYWGKDSTRPRWKIISNALAEQPDTRRLVVFTPDTVVVVYQNSATVVVGVEVRQTPPNEDQIDTGINGTFDVQVIAQGPGVAPFWLRVTIASGEGTITIQRDIVKEAIISDQGVFRVDAPLRVRVLAPGSF